MPSTAAGRRAAAALGFLDGADDGASDVEQPEDAISYTVFFPRGTPSTAATGFRDAVAALGASTAPEHAWSRDPLVLHVIPEDAATPLHLRGRTRVGEALDDEWWITWLLVTVSKSPPFTDSAVLHLEDADGQFLAIEAAEALPEWATPELLEANRLFVFRGEVHMIPPPPQQSSPAAVPHALFDVPSAAAGAEHVRKHAAATRASPAVQAAISARLSTVPAAAQSSSHVARLLLPASAALVFSSIPSALPLSVATFCGRDPIDERAATRLAVVRPSPLVSASIRFPRVAYAQLAGQRYTPPPSVLSAALPSTAGAWGAPAVLPPRALDTTSAAEIPHATATATQWRQLELGCKLAAGLEMLLWRRRGEGPGADVPAKRLVAACTAGAAPHSDPPRLRRYLTALHRRGYFTAAPTVEEREARLRRAREFWASVDAAAGGAGGSGGTVTTAAPSSELAEAAAEAAGASGRLSTGEDIDDETVDAIVTLLLAADAAAASAAPLPPLPSVVWPPHCNRDDDDGWMRDEGAVNARLASYDGRSAAATAPTTTAVQEGGAPDAQLTGLMTAMKGFLRGSSDVDGVEHEGGGGKGAVATEGAEGEGDDDTSSDSSADEAAADVEPSLPPLDVDAVVALFQRYTQRLSTTSSTALSSGTATEIPSSLAPYLDLTPFLSAPPLSLRAPPVPELDDADDDDVGDAEAAEAVAALGAAVSAQEGGAGPASTLLAAMGAPPPAQWWRGDALPPSTTAGDGSVIL